jgi:hypothetical protein
MKPLPFFTDAALKRKMANTLAQDQVKRPRTIKEYLAQIATDSEESANIMIDISELHNHFLLDFNEKNKDPATRFSSLVKQFKENHGIEFIHKNAIKIDEDCFMELVHATREYRAKTTRFNRRLNVFLLTHGGPAWFFGPVQDYFREKIGMVWVEDDSKLRSFYKHSHFVLSPTQLYFFPKAATVAINCKLNAENLIKFQEIFNKNALKQYFQYDDHFKIKAMSRAELRAIADFVSFDIEINDDDVVGWVQRQEFNKKMQPIMANKHFVLCQTELYFYDGDDYIKMMHADMNAIKCLFAKDKNNLSDSKTSDLQFHRLSKDKLLHIKKNLGLTGITWAKVPFRQVDFNWGERSGSRFIFNMFEDLKNMTGTQIEHVFLHSCFSAAEFYNEHTENHLFSCARMFSTLFKDSYITGCVGLNADAKATNLYTQEDISEESELLIPRHYNLTDSFVTYKEGLLIKKPIFNFAIKAEGPYLKNLLELLFKNESRTYLQLQHLDEVFKMIVEKPPTSFAYQQAQLYPKCSTHHLI